MRSSLMAIIGVMVGLSSGPADAADMRFYQYRTTGGCILWESEIPSNYDYAKFKGHRTTYVWDGPCTPGAPINGSGTMTLQHADAGGRNWWYKMAGTMLDGVWEGSISGRSSFYPDDPKAGLYRGGCNLNVTAFSCTPHVLPATLRSRAGARPSVSQSASVGAVASIRNGLWQGQQSGNQVKLETRPGGIFVTPVTQNAGQTVTGFMYRAAGGASYRFKFPDGKDSVMQILGSNQLRVTNPDGWTDLFKPVG